MRHLPEPTPDELNFSYDLDELKKRLSHHDWEAESTVKNLLSDIHERPDADSAWVRCRPKGHSSTATLPALLRFAVQVAIFSWR